MQVLELVIYLIKEAHGVEKFLAHLVLEDLMTIYDLIAQQIQEKKDLELLLVQ